MDDDEEGEEAELARRYVLKNSTVKKRRKKRWGKISQMQIRQSKMRVLTVSEVCNRSIIQRGARLIAR